MAAITLNIPDAHVVLVIDSFAVVFGFDPLKEPIQTKAQFAKGKLRDYIKEIVVRAEQSKRIGLLQNTLQTEVDGIDIT